MNKKKLLDVIENKIMQLVQIHHFKDREETMHYRIYDNECYEYIELTREEYKLLLKWLTHIEK